MIDAGSGARLGTIGGSRGSSVLTPGGTTGWRLEQQSIVKLKITRFLTGKTISLPQPVAGGAQLAMSPSGHFLVAETAGGATIVTL